MGYSHKLLEELPSREFDISISVPLVLEYEAQLKKHLPPEIFSEEDIDDFIDYICKIGHKTSMINDTKEQLEYILTSMEDVKLDDYVPIDEDSDICRIIDEYMNSLWEEYKKEFSSDKDAFGEFAYRLMLESTVASIDVPDVFAPYYFVKTYNVLETISSEFEITLPSMPAKKDYKGRFYLYREICKVLYRFRHDNGLSPYELYAFLYDFAPKYIGGSSSYIINDLPEPKSTFCKKTR